MRKLKARVIVLFVGTLLTLGLSYQMAHASGCADLEGGGNVYGDYDCRFFKECGGYCYYNCTCSNLFPGYTCNDVLHAAGFEDIDPSDPCLE